MIKMIVCMARNGAIGNKGDLLYSLPNDMKHFVEYTRGNVVVMGKNTALSLPGGKPLKNRVNVVLTHNPIEGFECYDNIEDILNKYSDFIVIGGGKIYELFMPYTDEISLTIVDDVPTEFDTIFCAINQSEWKYEECEHYSADEKHKYNFDIYTLKRL